LKFTDTVLTFTDCFKCSKCLSSTLTDEFLPEPRHTLSDNVTQSVFDERLKHRVSSDFCSTLYAFYTRSSEARYYMYHLLYTKTLRFFHRVNLRVSYDVRLNSDHFPIQYYPTGLRNGNAVCFRRSHRVRRDEYGGSSTTETYWRPKRCVNIALYGKAKRIRWRKFSLSMRVMLQTFQHGR